MEARSGGIAMHGWPFLALLLLLGSGLFAAWREPPPEAGDLSSLSPLLETATGAPIRSRRTWQQRRNDLRRRWTEYLGPFPRRVALKPQVLATEEFSDHTRLRVRYRTEADVFTEAYLLLPKDGRTKRPGMVVLHQTTENTIDEPVGKAGREPMHIALHLVRRGYVCIAPRCFLWSEADTLADATERVLTRPPWKTGMAKMTWDGIRALDYLLTWPEVDPERVGCIGHSLGGKEALYLGAFDPRIRATISCEGGIGLRFSNWDARWYLGPQIREPPLPPPSPKRGGSRGNPLGEAAVPLEHHQLIALIAPRPFLLIGGGSADGPQSWPFIAANLPVYRLLGAEERIGLQLIEGGHDFPHAGPEREKTFAWLDHWLR
jgi:pimeloyl-ACP methyl ester carboxylesterase